jgi:hypothetical protein
MTHKFGWKLAVWVLLCVCVSSGTAQFGRRPWGRRGNGEMKKWVKEMRQRQAEQAAYSNGQVFVYLTPEGRLKRVASKSVKLAKKTKQEALELHQAKQLAYTQARGKFLEKNHGQKYARLKPFKPEFITLKADIVQHTNRAPTLEPKEHYYGLYKVEVDGKVTYELGYAFSDAAQQIKYQPRYVSKYNRWIRKSKPTTEPIAPVFEMLCERMTKPSAQKAATAMATWQKQHDLWVKRGSKPESEPEKPDLSIYQEELSRAEKWKNSRRQPDKDKAKDDPKEKPEPEEKKETPKTKKDAGWS